MEEEKKKGNKIVLIAIGMLIGAIIMAVIAFIWPFNSKTVAQVGYKRITADDLYNKMSFTYGLSYLLEDADKIILDKLYVLNDEMKKEIDDQAQNYISYYNTYYKYTQEEFLKANGFDNYDEFINVLTLDYRRKLYYTDYLEKLIPAEEINNYYETEVFGDINSKHILIEITDEVTEEKALALANKIVKALNSGSTFDEVVEKYKDSTTYEELGYTSFDSSIDSAYIEALKQLKNNEYTTTPVKTSYGYHIIYKIEQKEKASFEEIKDRIIVILGESLEKEDENLYYKALIDLRKENKLIIKDEKVKSVYAEYCKNIENK